MRPFHFTPAGSQVLRSFDCEVPQPRARRLLARVAAAVMWIAVAVAVTVDVDAAELPCSGDSMRGGALTSLLMATPCPTVARKAVPHRCAEALRR